MRSLQAQYERDFTALKHYLIGRDYTEALRAMGIAVRWHVGFRKDKVTPQLHHQVWVCFNFLNVPIKGLTLMMEERAISALLCHDTVEDHPITPRRPAQRWLEATNHPTPPPPHPTAT